jgi:hypothetical protein
MTSTMDHADYLSVHAVAPATPNLNPEAVADEQIDALRARPTPQPDPGARARIAGILYRITGWEMFAADERAYVSRLWAEDWDSPEDSVYDGP